MGSDPVTNGRTNFRRPSLVYGQDGYIHHGYTRDMPADAGPTALLPLPPAAFHILLALADGDRHGYAIIQEVAARTGGEVRLGAGTLYRSIQRMVEQGLIEETAARPRRSSTTSGGATTASPRSAWPWRGPRPSACRRWCGWPGPAASPRGGPDARLSLAAPPLPRRPARGVRRRDGRDFARQLAGRRGGPAPAA